MIQFSNNDCLFEITKLIFFEFANKNFYFYITFESNDIIFNFIQKQLLIVKVKNIINIMINFFKFMQNNVEQFRKIILT